MHSKNGSPFNAAHPLVGLICGWPHGVCIGLRRQTGAERQCADKRRAAV